MRDVVVDCNHAQLYFVANIGKKPAFNYQEPVVTQGLDRFLSAVSNSRKGRGGCV